MSETTSHITSNRRTVAFQTLGCKLNFAETSALKQQFRGGRFEIRSFDDYADVYVINTCSVTQNANRDCRKTVRKAQKINPDAFIAVTGCYAQLEPEVIAAIDGVDLVLGANEKFDILELAGDFQKPDQTVIHHTDVNEAVDFHHAFSSSDRTRAFLKVQDGCDYKCSFCTIPLARGKSRSPEIGDIVENARQLISNGYREIVLTGVNVGDFGKQSGESLLDLLEILDSLKGLSRMRISSIEPNLLTEEIVDFAAASNTLQPHFHIPLQSGSDRLLRLMKRRYDTDLYRNRLEYIHSRLPDACIGVDVITGHPGETDEIFEESLSFIQSLNAGYLHVFTYSERPNTTALSLGDTVPVPVRKTRTHMLRRISEQKKFDFDSKFLGRERTVLFEDHQQDGLIQGWTDNYIRACVPYDDSLINQLVRVRLGERHPAGTVTASIPEMV
ncbi:tRNA (N(6)-L-threonylcarbamoyladenosine(37)-C(2))-methylthiotransferase MtaB [Natronogracilivirga saccharolytica]|uniref:tRNA (N(6)-L-threonylcarbamoyladenosine(37)-C(2))-methylthiotransferase MtaB n=1 Tax=Natronogracilivirga saccharolytica TaxID=2812953 RepID=A0A8J7RIK8_9BACT|nr:tRNA (N(6)-L-threonylcarbamoyladenosine(37)-C(2))-methylthiotransferase MtaB [Natronogracilivirga saccharolytica]MBP3192445.1 tRNA (N(6)-L-threonylcarbamoyladenosine(37)-C(2))-methylthiotransferase MtaB [Natronogracilivirga saccharolytica]